ncbi:hypothetical protein [Shewanella sp. FDAARGOS_354]|uniref:hypothetical protein n=1 Tax=Shewanella sp. FDAARGOS_354 TaxID=1930557 RepID=UPI000B51A124|nr:hypothetical protein [Shewanella sp. FDAARGOS_354]ASF15676.1 hypothetical protein CEQ32_12320 [Shewanella sp. FDAARGOS_354]
MNTEPFCSLLPHPVFKNNDYLGVTTILTQGGYGTYVIQDYLKGVAPGSYQLQNFDTRAQTVQNSVNQLTILHSLLGRIDSVLANIDTELLSEIQDAELETARQLSKISLRAAGSLVGVVIENHLQKLANNHGIKSRKKHPTISDLNDPLKNEGVFDTPTWRKVTYLADIRNICSHKKDIEPTKEQINELIEGANWLIKNTF